MDELARLPDPERWEAAMGNVARRLHLSCEEAARLIETLAADGDWELVDAIACGASVVSGSLV
jgi:hypothetical protein